MTPDEYRSHDATGLARLVAAGDASPREVTEAAIASIKAENATINAVVSTCFEQALDSLGSLPPGPLHGVPWLVKDFTTTLAGLPHTNGSRALADVVPVADGELVRRHRAAGLVILGKTNTPEFGMNICTAPSLFGPTRHPLDPNMSVGGSSGGAGAAVAAKMVPAAHATDSGGSIRIPAANCGLFGLKPSRSRVPLGHDQSEGLAGLSTAHAVTQSVRDSALLLDLTHGPLPGDSSFASTTTGSFLEALDRPQQQLRVGLCTEGFAGEVVSPECVVAATETAHLLERMGYSVEPVPSPIDGEALRSSLDTLFAVNIATVVANVDASRRELLEAATRAAVDHSKRFSGVDYVQAQADMRRAVAPVSSFFNKFDVLLTPTLTHPPRPIGYHTPDEDDWPTYFTKLLDDIAFTTLFNASGGPAMSLPLAHSATGLPIGVQIGSAVGGEEMLLGLARAIEVAAPWHRLI